MTDPTRSIPRARSRAPAAAFAAAAEWLGSRSAFVLMLLLLEAGLLLGVAQVAADLRAQRAPQAGATRGAAGAVCADAAVTFRRTATERDMTLLLVQYGATIVYGPDENGAYEVRVAPGDARAATLQALRDAPIVADLGLSAACR
ncbi:hypothetical protein BLA13014_08188 [Burkholderia aenigmatica]|uniref:Uncharacterized protein n=1 Tax=Burkholderia aenigmatica TaxID=2015348 RepID=A0A6P2T598_9BURK|nr:MULTISPECIES: hypothetical protein [Burkholderia]MDN7515215.1 hypothetical protein [Burkholderia sp. AU45251]VWC53451.1 hypothetical protein BLA13014_08188 [Burkholderia aenigmatica]HDR9482150.1 hypothetical protein [Burkholderia aenigmatica]HDR9515617.1 hypothetical protein [Burkholderia aenigmatica]HDR9590521.1 hypothetical protein [Burkholderia aenigmatica]